MFTEKKNGIPSKLIKIRYDRGRPPEDPLGYRQEERKRKDRTGHIIC